MTSVPSLAHLWGAAIPSCCSDFPMAIRVFYRAKVVARRMRKLGAEMRLIQWWRWGVCRGCSDGFQEMYSQRMVRTEARAFHTLTPQEATPAEKNYRAVLRESLGWNLTNREREGSGET